MTWLGWIRLSVDVFDHLLRRSHVHLVNEANARSLPPLPSGHYYLLECFPTSTWRTSSLAPLPAHAKAPPRAVTQFARDLWARFGLPNWADLDEHDELQAVVAALPAVGILDGPCLPIPRGEPSRRVPGGLQIPPHTVEGLIWDAAPIPALAGPEPRLPEREQVPGTPTSTVTLFAVAQDYDNPILPDERDPSAPVVLERGVRLFRELAARANAGHPTGIGYAQFVAHVYGVHRFNDVTGRPYRPSDSGFVIRLALEITAANPGRIPVTRDGVTIQAGMDSFIWNSGSPFDRPLRAWASRWGSLPYTRDEWLQIFPDGRRRLYDAKG